MPAQPAETPRTAGPGAITWTDAARLRAAGVLAGMACGDALGAPYEFGPPLAVTTVVDMCGGGSFGWKPGEWTDDTQMAVVILQAAESAVADGARLTDRLDDVVTGWVEWARTATDVGAQTRTVLAEAAAHGRPTAATCTAAATALHARTGRSGGNGSLMRTAPVALAYLDDVDALAHAARAVSDLTHHDPDAGDACVLWCAAIRHAVLTGELDVLVGLDLLPAERRTRWTTLVAEAERRQPAEFEHNGWVVEAFQAAWSAIVHSRQGESWRDDPDHLRRGLEAAVRGGRDTDTVAAIAGALLGAHRGAMAVPERWSAVTHGWPGLGFSDLAARGALLARGMSAATPGSSAHDEALFEIERTWAGQYNGYDRLAGGVSELSRLLDPVQTETTLTGQIPDWAGTDLLRGWAFYLLRADRHGGGYGLARDGAMRGIWAEIMDAVRRHHQTGLEPVPEA